MDHSLPGTSVHGDSPGKNTGLIAIRSSKGSFPTQGSNPGLPHCRRILYQLSYQGSSYIASSEMKKRKQGLLISLLLLFHKDQGLRNSQPSWEPNSSALNQATKEADLDAQISALSFLLRNLSQGSPWRSSGEDSTLSLPTGPGSLPSQNRKPKAEWCSTGGKKKNLSKSWERSLELQ